MLLPCGGFLGLDGGGVVHAFPGVAGKREWR